MLKLDKLAKEQILFSVLFYVLEVFFFNDFMEVKVLTLGWNVENPRGLQDFGEESVYYEKWQ